MYSDASSIKSSMNDSLISHSSGVSINTVKSRNTKKTLDRNGRIITNMLLSYGNNPTAQEIRDLINSDDCSVRSLTVFGDNYKIVNRKTGEQYLLLEEGIVKGNVRFSKGFLPWSENKLEGPGLFVKANDMSGGKYVVFNGKISDKNSQVYNYNGARQRHSCKSVLRSSDVQLVTCNTKVSKTDLFVAGLRATFNTAKEVDLELDTENPVKMVANVAKNAFNIIPNAVENFKEEFAPKKMIEVHTNMLKKPALKKTRILEDGLNLVYTQDNVILNDKYAFEDFLQQKTLFGLGKINLKNCSYIGYLEGQRDNKNKNKINSINIQTSKTDMYPCIISFTNGDLIYGVQKNNCLIGGYYCCQKENKTLSFSNDSEDKFLQSLCTSIDRLGALTSEQKQVAINETERRAYLAKERQVNSLIRKSYTDLYVNLVKSVFKNNIQILWEEAKNNLLKEEKNQYVDHVKQVLEISGTVTSSDDINLMFEFNDGLSRISKESLFIQKDKRIEQFVKDFYNNNIKNKADKNNNSCKRRDLRLIDNKGLIYYSMNTIDGIKGFLVAKNS